MDPAITASTYRYERLRAVSSGVIESAAATFLLLIALRWYQAGSVAKAIVAGGSSCGLLLSPAAVYWTARLRWTTSLASSRLMAIACACMLAPAIVPWESVFVIGTTFSLIASSSCVPLFTQFYQENYPAEIRGRLFSRTFMIRIAAAAVMSGIGGIVHCRRKAGRTRFSPGGMSEGTACSAEPW